jgi:hypothetical protein
VQGELADVVISIRYTITGHEEGRSFVFAGTAVLPAPDEDNFISFDDITKDWAIGAVEGSVDIAAIKAMIEHQIELMKSPSPVTVFPPF